MTAEEASDRRSYHLIERIGAGAFGEVFLAEVRSTEVGFSRRVAIKLLQPQHRHAEASQRIRDEARLLGHIHHRAVVSVVDLVHIEDRWAVIMDYVPGGDLAQVAAALGTRNEATPVPAALEIAAEVAAALQAALEATDGAGKALGIVHRDVKPSNVRLTPDGDVKVLDFGLAWGDLSTREAASDGHVLGTRSYMGPERLRGGGGDCAGDVYALAKMLAELLTGRTFGSSPTSGHATWVRERIDEVRARVGDGPTGSLLVPLLSRALSEDPTVRPTATELADQLRYLARSATGEDLQSFARRVVPRLAETLGEAPVPASGTLVEAISGAARYTPLPLTTLDRLAPTPPPAPQHVSTPVPSQSSGSSGGAVFVTQRRTAALPLALVAVALSAAALGLVLWMGQSAPEPVKPDGPQVQSLVVASTPTRAVPASAPPEVAPVASAPPRAVAAPPRPQVAPPSTPAPVLAPPTPSPVLSVPVVESPVPSETVTEPPVAAPVMPAPIAVTPPLNQPEPVVHWAPIAGTWVGSAGGRPLTLRIDSRPPQLTGTAEVVQGPSVRTVDLAGTLDQSGRFALAEVGGGMVFSGKVAEAALVGSWQLKAGGKAFDLRLAHP
ncbi:MAG: serine/threonine protein kinase [Deltaproteobacteria bacterium]|nr:MAG: serine/threonine protein kinase [Deltaproteobacteria bacterium]